MSHTGLRLLAPDDFQPLSMTLEMVRFGAWVRLPFRIRTGSLFSVSLKSPELMDIWVLNKFEIPEGSTFQQSHKKAHDIGLTGYDHLWSEILISIRCKELTSEQLAKIKNQTGSASDDAEIYFRAMRGINAFICAYSVTTNELFGGAPLRALTDMDFFNCLYAEMTIVCPAEYQLTSTDVNEVFKWKPEREIRSLGQLTGKVDDLPAERLARLADVADEIQQHAFHEIAFKAKSEMVDRDPLVALVLACAALEGAHATFLRLATKPRFVGAERPDDLVTDLLREQGIHTMLRVTPFLFMDSQRRPTNEMIKRCKEAIEIRNDIMHAKVLKSGEYKIRQHTNSDLTKAYKGLVEMYELYTNAIRDTIP